MMNLWIMAWLALSTLASEDAASIGGGLLVRDGHLPLAHAIAACVAGVYFGDLGLWWAGRAFGGRLLRVPWLARRLAQAPVAVLAGHVDDRLGAAIIASRFVPGSRLPVYVAAGIWGRRPVAFAAWSLLAVLVWTPLLVTFTVYFGSSAVTPVLHGIEIGVLGSLLTGAAVWWLVGQTSRAAAAIARRYHHRHESV